MTKTIAIAGASGWLGRKIAMAVLDRGATPRLLLRDGEAHPKASSLSDLVARGARIVAADMGNPDSLRTALAGANVIVSALQGGPDIIIDGQQALAIAGLAEGVERIFPSDFAVDFSAIPVEDHLFLGWRRLAQAAIADTGLAQTNTYIGAFTEMLRQPFFGLVDWEKGLVTCWGEPDQPYDFTTTDDTAQIVASAALSDAPINGPLCFAGDTQSPAAIAAIAAKISGRPFGLQAVGDLAALRARIAAEQKAAPDTPFAWVGLQYHLAMASGSGKLTELANPRFPDMEPRSVEGFLSDSR